MPSKVFSLGHFRDRSNSSPQSSPLRNGTSDSNGGNNSNKTATTDPIIPSASAHSASPSRDSPQPSPPPSRESTRRPTTMLQPLIDIAKMKGDIETLPELVRILKYLTAHTQKVFQEGYFQKLNDLNPDGLPVQNRVWMDCYAQLIGSVLSIWDAKALEEEEERTRRGLAPEKEVAPTFINLQDATMKMISSLPQRTAGGPPLTNVLSVSTAGRNRYLLHFAKRHELAQWTAAIRLSMYEHSCLHEAYTGSLIAGKGPTLNSIKDYIQRHRFKEEDWCKVRFGAGTPWRRCWAVVTPPDEKAYQKRKKAMKKQKNVNEREFEPLYGDIKFYENKKVTKKSIPIATVVSAYAAYAIYPETPALIDQSTLIKVEGNVMFHTDPPTVSEGFVFMMPEHHINITGFEMMLRFLMPIYDAFALYGRPKRLAADVIDGRSLLFAFPKEHGQRYGFLDVIDVLGLVASDDSQNFSEAEWRRNLKDLTSKRMLGAVRRQSTQSRRSLPAQQKFGSAVSFDDASSRKSTQSSRPYYETQQQFQQNGGYQNQTSLTHQRSISEARGYTKYQGRGVVPPSQAPSPQQRFDEHGRPMNTQLNGHAVDHRGPGGFSPAVGSRGASSTHSSQSSHSLNDFPSPNQSASGAPPVPPHSTLPGASGAAASSRLSTGTMAMMLANSSLGSVAGARERQADSESQSSSREYNRNDGQYYNRGPPPLPDTGSLFDGAGVGPGAAAIQNRNIPRSAAGLPASNMYATPMSSPGTQSPSHQYYPPSSFRGGNAVTVPQPGGERPSSRTSQNRSIPPTPMVPPHLQAYDRQNSQNSQNSSQSGASGMRSPPQEARTMFDNGSTSGSSEEDFDLAQELKRKKEEAARAMPPPLPQLPQLSKVQSAGVLSQSTSDPSSRPEPSRNSWQAPEGGALRIQTKGLLPQRKPVPSHQRTLLQSATSNSSRNSVDSLEGMRVNEAALDRVLAMDAMNSGGSSPAGASQMKREDSRSVYGESDSDGEGDSIDYASTKESVKAAAPRRGSPVRTGVLKTVGQVEEPTEVQIGEARYAIAGSARKISTDNGMPQVDFGPTMNMGHSRGFSVENFGTQQQQQKKPQQPRQQSNESVNRLSRVMNQSSQPTSSQTSTSGAEERSDRRSVLWQPGMVMSQNASSSGSGSNTQVYDSAESFVKDQALRAEQQQQFRSMAAAHNRKASNPMLSGGRPESPALQGGRTSSNEGSRPHSRNYSGDRPPSRDMLGRPPSRDMLGRPPSRELLGRPSSRNSGHLINDYASRLTAQEQEYVARATGTPLLGNDAAAKKEPPHQAGLLGVLETRDREKREMREGRANIMVHQAIQQRQFQNQVQVQQQQQQSRAQYIQSLQQQQALQYGGNVGGGWGQQDMHQAQQQQQQQQQGYNIYTQQQQGWPLNQQQQQQQQGFYNHPHGF